MNFNDVVRLYQSQVLSHEAYRMNLVDILGANENAHTRILEHILKYDRNDGRGKLFLKSFVDCFLPDFKIDVVNPEIRSQVRNIDAVIAERGSYVVIIENKINWAVDQGAQIERYVEDSERLYNVPGDRIYAIYLTDDGQKKVSNISLTDKVKRVLGVTATENGRFVELNYRYDILPWLQREALPNCRYRESELIAALEQYIYYLQARFGELNNHGVKEEERLVGELLIDSSCIKDRYRILKGLVDESMEEQGCDTLVSQRASLFLREKARSLLSQDYSIDFAEAVKQKSEFVRAWARKLGFKPRKYYETTTYFQFVKGEHRSRIKFQIDFSDRDESVWVQFFDNDRSFKITTFVELRELATRLFAGIEEVDPYVMRWKTSDIKNESNLYAFLEGPIRLFLEAFCATFPEQV